METASSVKVSLNPDGYLEVVASGDQNEDSWKKVYKDAEPLLNQLRTKGQPINALIDLTNMGGFTTGSNKSAMDILEHLDYQKIAMVIVNPALNEVVKLIILAMGKDENTKLFHTRDEAVAWLLA
jgi:hypothetical protein